MHLQNQLTKRDPHVTHAEDAEAEDAEERVEWVADAEEEPMEVAEQ